MTTEFSPAVAGVSGPSFDIPPAMCDLQQRMATFIRQEVMPHEDVLRRPADLTWDLVHQLRARARAAGVYGPHIPHEYGGLQLDWRSIAIAFEEAGASLLGPPAINASAPDEANIHLLHKVATSEQKERFLAPLARGEIRSCFAMTEPSPGAGADPAMLRTRAERTHAGWILNGHKWWTTGAQGARFAIVMARTSDSTDPRRGATMFLVPTDAPGFEVVRNLGAMDHAFLGGHAEVRLNDVQLDDAAILGEPDLGFDYAQVRLAGGRLTHCMRWLGLARRALETATHWATTRTSGGSALGEHQMVQAMLADSAIELHAARLMIWHAAWVLDSGGPAREETSMAKVFVAETVNRVIDRCVQICGGMGTSDEMLLGLYYREVRPFRIYDGPSEVHRASIARRLLRRSQREHAG